MTPVVSTMAAVPPMTPVRGSRLAEAPGAEAALRELCGPFVRGPFVPLCALVQPDEIPHPQDQLLVHHEHMTVVLQKYHGRPVAVRVMEEHLSGDYYTRKIALTPEGADRVVEWGIVRLDFRYMAAEVRDEILAKRLPLGAVLIKHNVLRRIKPRWFMRFPPGGAVLDAFGARATTDLYGRIGMIYCDEEPAIEVLEIVDGIEGKNAE
jgi:hypothetical protein